MDTVYRAQSARKEEQAAHMQQLKSKQTDLSDLSTRLQKAQENKLQTESNLQQLSEKLSLHEQAQQQVTICIKTPTVQTVDITMHACSDMLEKRSASSAC